MTHEIQAIHVNEILRISAEVSDGDTEMQMNLLVRALILATLHYKVPPELVIRNFMEMYQREPENVMGNIKQGLIQ